MDLVPQHITITHKTTAINAGGTKIDAGLVGPCGTFTIACAGRMVLFRRAEFFFNGERLIDLALLPEQ